MLQQLINRSSDLKRLRDEGYEVEVKGGHLIVHHIPYVNQQRRIAFGKLVSTLNLNNNETIRPETHIINFSGDHPCNKDGSIIQAIQHATLNQLLDHDIMLNFSFSNKPPEGYKDYYEKVSRYAEIISSPARSIQPAVTAKTFSVIEDHSRETVFNYIDSNSSRANISKLASKFEGHRIGIIGLGGTGSYILDSVAKTGVAEIHLFDGDLFLQHNAFRSPGAPSLKQLADKRMKVDYFFDIYSRMHRGIKKYGVFIDEENQHLLQQLTFVFLCVDSNQFRSKIMSALRKLSIPFIDVGLGVNLIDDKLIGTLRSTLVTSDKYDHIKDRVGFEDFGDDEYATNIQISDLNAFNGLMAILRWKKFIGFYQDLKSEHHSTFTINTGQLLHGDYWS